MSQADWQTAVFKALKILKQAGCDLADIFVEDTRNTRLKIEDSQPEEMVGGRESGAGLRLIRGQATFFASTNDITPRGLKTAAEALVNSAGRGQNASDLIRPKRAKQNFAIPPTPPISWEEKIQLAMIAERAGRKAGAHIRQVTVFFSHTQQQVAIAGSEGQWCEDDRIQTVLWVNAVAAQEGQIQTGYESMGGSQGWEYFKNHNPETLGRIAGQRAEMLLQARPAPSGRMPVVLGAPAGGTMIHEAIGHSLEADLILKGLSPFTDKVGQEVASPLISVVDDATCSGWRGSFRFDDEGTSGQRTVLVEKGILKGFMHDKISARQMGVSPTGNGRRQSYAFRPIPRMTNTQILPGEEIPEKIIRSVSQGLYVARMGGGQVNTVNGDFIFEVNEGYLIENGKLGEPVRGASLIGNGQEILKSIDRVGSDHGQSIGTCGKDDQGVPVADAQPTLRIPEMTIGGS